jgi:hypothetical protein
VEKKKKKKSPLIISCSRIHAMVRYAGIVLNLRHDAVRCREGKKQLHRLLTVVCASCIFINVALALQPVVETSSRGLIRAASLRRYVKYALRSPLHRSWQRELPQGVRSYISANEFQQKSAIQTQVIVTIRPGSGFIRDIKKISL